MKTTLFLSTLLLTTQVSASWFGSEPEYKQWDTKKLNAWLKEHDISVPRGYSKDEVEALVEKNWYAGQAWSEKQIADAQSQFENVKEKTIDTWTDSQIREFLVNQGLVAPSGPREQLVLAAKKQYWSYNSAVSSASAAASTAIFGDSVHQATKSASSVASSATDAASEAAQYVQNVVADTLDSTSEQLDITKDYVYSTWSDNELRTWLEDKGLIKTKAQARRDELLSQVHAAYRSAADPVWSAWGDSYLFNWLHSRGLVKTDAEKKRDQLIKSAEKYYYGAQDKAYTNWNESELKQWLVENGVIKSDAQIQKEKLQKLVADNYAQAQSTIWGGWKDSDIREWLIDNGYLRSDAQVKRDELIKLANEKYNDVTAASAAYLTWPDARLRAYLRAHGVDDRYLPATRPGLLQETRVRWVQSKNTVEQLIQQLRDTVGSVFGAAEEKAGSILESVTGTSEEALKKAEEARKVAAASASSVSAEAAKKTQSLKEDL